MAAKPGSQDWRAEAVCFGHYLIGEAPKHQAVELYVRALQSRSQKLSAAEDRLLQFACQHPWSVGYLDAGLAFSRPSAELRQRLYVMLAILETVPDYADTFLPGQHSRAYLFRVAWTACKAAFKALVGVVLVQLAI